jgi:hypothetical protein
MKLRDNAGYPRGVAFFFGTADKQNGRGRQIGQNDKRQYLFKH